MKKEFPVKAADSYKVYNVYIHRFYADQLLLRKFKNFDLTIRLTRIYIRTAQIKITLSFNFLCKHSTTFSLKSLLYFWI